MDNPKYLELSNEANLLEYKIKLKTEILSMKEDELWALTQQVTNTKAEIERLIATRKKVVAEINDSFPTGNPQT